MIGFIIRRLVMLLPVLLIVGIVVFTLVHLTPGDPAAVMLGPEATGSEIEDLRERLGLNEPIYQQFINWFRGVLQFDLGQSMFLGMPVADALVQRAGPTGFLTIYALTVSLVIGIPFGVIAAVRRNSPLDRGLMLVSVSGMALPNFFFAILMILLFAVVLQWLPSGGYVSPTEDLSGHFKRMIMPAFALGFHQAALLARLVRSSMLDVLKEDYIRTAYAKGIARRSVVVGHALRNALIPAITVVGTSLGTLLGGSVVIETVFTLPGMGQLVVQSVLRRDYPVIQGAVMIIAGAYVMANLLVDVLYVYLDPRLKHGG